MYKSFQKSLNNFCRTFTTTNKFRQVKAMVALHLKLSGLNVFYLLLMVDVTWIAAINWTKSHFMVISFVKGVGVDT